MLISENEVATLIDRLRSLNVIAWELVGLVPAKGNHSLITILEAVINETDALVDRFDQGIGQA